MPLYIAQQLLGSQKNIRKKRRDMLAEDALEDDADEAAVRPVLFAPLARQEAQQYLLSAIEDYVERDEDSSTTFECFVSVSQLKPPQMGCC